MLGSADATPYDLRFRLFRIPVRVHPLFWLIMLMLGSNTSDLRTSLVFVGCAFVSIVVHELGHGLSGRLMGDEPVEIVLYSMGGYCAFQRNQLSSGRRILMLFCGPGAGFILFGLVLTCVLVRDWPESPIMNLVVNDLLYINLVWGILNLFPLWPLDGGQITVTFLSMLHRRNGAGWGHVISLLMAGGLAVWRLSVSDFWMVVWFGYFAMINYQMLQTLHRAVSYREEGDAWRR